MTQYFVVGGEYTGTDFTTIAEGGREARFGPFATYGAAHEEWHAQAWRSVDNCYARYRIVDDSGAIAPRPKEV